MKLLINVPNCFELNLVPRDVRNYVGAIVNEKFKDKVMWHENDLSPVIYPKTYKGGFEIVNYFNDVELMQHIKNMIETHRNFFGKEIKSVRFINEQYEIPQRQEMVYIARTPVIIAGNLLKFQAPNYNDYINYRIKSDVLFQIKKIFGVDFDFDLKVMLEDVKRMTVKYKDDVILPALTMKLYSNYTLPRFIGYKTGLGWGELSELSSDSLRLGLKRSMSRG